MDASEWLPFSLYNLKILQKTLKIKWNKAFHFKLAGYTNECPMTNLACSQQ